jgi:hypothetical protein
MMGVGMVPRASYDVLKREKEDLEEQLKGREKRLLRLKEVSDSCLSLSFFFARS